MLATVRAAFEESAARLEPTEHQRADASAKYGGVVTCIASDLNVHTWFLMGSYGRRTIVRPPQEIDLFVAQTSQNVLHQAEVYHEVLQAAARDSAPGRG